MKITKRQLKRIIKEELIKQSPLTEFFGPNWEEEAANLDEPPPITKVGDLRKLIKALQSDKRSKKGMKGLADISAGIVADMVPGAGTALSVASTLKAMYSAPDDKKTNTALDKMNVDDEIAAIVDDTVEDNFLIKAMELIEGLSDDADIPDINQELSDWLKSKYEARTVIGFDEGKRVKITKRQLRRIIKEALTGPPQTVEEWMYWGGEFDLSAEEDNDGQTIFYLSADQPDRARIAAGAVEAGAQVDTDYEGNDIIYTGAYSQSDQGPSSDWDHHYGGRE
jgi:hypothetical protein